MSGQRKPLIEAGELKQMLAGRILSLCQELLPNGVKEGHEYRVGGLDGSPGRSLGIHVGNGPRAGVWSDFASGERGDALDLIAAVLFAKDMKRAFDWSRSWLGLDHLDPGRIQQERRAAQARAEKADRQAREEDQRKRNYALRLFLSGDPIVGTLVERYLAARAIGLDRLGRVPGCLRFGPAVNNGEAKRPMPAMLAAVTNLAGQHVATHRTWLAEPGTKANLVDPKLTIGRYRGAHIPLWKGRHRVALKDVPPGTEIVISEGIEDGLSVAVARPDVRVIAALSLSNMLNLELPPQAGRIIFAAQNDPPGSDAAETLQRVLIAHKALGRDVYVMRPPAGVKDFNIMLQDERARSAEQLDKAG